MKVMSMGAAGVCQWCGDDGGHSTVQVPAVCGGEGHQDTYDLALISQLLAQVLMVWLTRY